MDSPPVVDEGVEYSGTLNILDSIVGVEYSGTLNILDSIVG